jgi:hypothetical protein
MLALINFFLGLLTLRSLEKLKGQPSEFFTPVFIYIKQLILVPKCMPSSDRILSNFRGVIRIRNSENIDSPLSMTVGAKKMSLGQPLFLILINFPAEQCSTCMIDFMLQNPF